MFFYENTKSFYIVCVYACPPAQVPMSPEGDPLLSCLLVECRSCKVVMLCMPGIIYLFVVFICRPVDDVAFIYLGSPEPMLLGLVVIGGSSFL